MVPDLLHAQVSTSESGPRLREERKRLHLTQARLAAEVGISAPTQIGYERGSRTPDMHYLSAIEKLGLDERYIRTGVRANRAAVGAMDWDFFLSVQLAGEEWFQKQLGITLSRRESNEIARLLYEVLIDGREIDDTKVSRILRLVASRQ